MGQAATLSLNLGMSLAWLGFASWGALALWFRQPAGPQLLLPALWSIGAILILVYFICGQRRNAVLCMILLAATLMVWWSSLRPRADANWSPDVARMPTADIGTDRLTIENVRNFTWRSDADFTERWERRTYQFSDVTGADLFLSYWMGDAIAHAILSFSFADGRQLAWSIEVRRQAGEDYSALAGFFRHNEVVMVAADERDVVKVRATVRQEDVRLYRLDIRAETAQRLLRAYANEANELAATPRFYNTLLTNCTTVVYRLAKQLDPAITLDPRMVLSGYLPSYLYDHDFLDRRLPLAKLVERSRIAPRTPGAEDDPEFSQRIRVGVPDPRSADH
ncbi:MAG: hypothetical protein JWL93_2395 [Hyphomicrobiales bacterium]|nr:hypothetical protein [Hyphomicrobiales bacterium]